MSTIFVITNLSASSQNALDYACGFTYHHPVRIILLHVFSFSAGYAGDGVTMAALTEVTAYDESMLAAEKERILACYPDLQIETRMLAGRFEDTVLEQVAAEQAAMVVMGAEGDYNDLISWDNHILKVFIDLPVPVMIVPAEVRFNGLRQVAFACNYKREELAGPVQTLRRLITKTRSRLYFVHVNNSNTPLTTEELDWKQRWQQELTGLPVLFDELEATNIVATLDEFCRSQQIDLLVIRPHRAGIWEGILGKGQTKKIAHLNTIPVLALRAAPGDR